MVDPEENECTFSPQVVKAEGAKKRSMKKFLSDQEAFVKKTKEKRENAIKEETLQAAHARPVVNEPARREGGPVYERLYKLAKEASEKKSKPLRPSAKDE